MPNLPLLLDLLSYCRPAGSETDLEFCARFIAPHAAHDRHGNWHAYIPDADGSPSRVLWSCHTDTVHRADGRQTVSYRPHTGMVRLSRRSRKVGRNCLGADDTAGVYLCLQLIAAGVPGYYIFHYGEERGGMGSGDLALHDPDLLAECSIAIAFDRRGYSDVITHQSGMRCCSDLFAESLGDALNALDPTLTYQPSDRGLYTDTAEYPAIVAECTNLSVGYADEHTHLESLDVAHLFRLEAALCRLDTDALCVDRTPSDPYADYRYPVTLDLAPRDVDYLSQTYVDVQAALRRQVHATVCDWCGARTYGDDTHDCPYFSLGRRIGQ